MFWRYVFGRTSVTPATLRHLHLLSIQRFHERRRLEWRFAFTIWATLVAVAALVSDAGLARSTAAIIVTTAAIVLFLIHWVIEAKYFARESRSNWEEGVRLSRRVHRSAGLPTCHLPGPSDYKPFYAHWWQVAVTLILAVALSAMGWLPSASTETPVQAPVSSVP